jgi:hypothetical protein
MSANDMMSVLPVHLFIFRAQMAATCLCVPCAVVELPGRGFGLVATAPIKRGTRVWWPNPLALRVYKTEGEFMVRLAQLSDQEVRQLLVHVYGWRGGVLIELLDNSQFTNHSGKPTMRAGTDHHTMNESFATREIMIGEELTDDYTEYDSPAYYENLCAAYGVQSTNSVVNTVLQHENMRAPPLWHRYCVLFLIIVVLSLVLALISKA